MKANAWKRTSITFRCDDENFIRTAGRSFKRAEKEELEYLRKAFFLSFASPTREFN
jgi:hypothetical protein